MRCTGLGHLARLPLPALAQRLAKRTQFISYLRTYYEDGYFTEPYP